MNVGAKPLAVWEFYVCLVLQKKLYIKLRFTKLKWELAVIWSLVKGFQFGNSLQSGDTQIENTLPGFKLQPVLTRGMGVASAAMTPPIFKWKGECLLICYSYRILWSL